MRSRCLALVPFLLAGCLPDDTRPAPAEVTITAAGSAFTTGQTPAAVTADGFRLAIRRFIVSIGEGELGQSAGSDCNVYSNPSYTRILDFTQVTAPSELGLAYATGECSFAFRVRPPDDLDLLGPGVDAADGTFLRTPGDDPDSRNAGVSVYVEGDATRDGQSWHFAWPFRKHIRYTGCSAWQRNLDAPGVFELAGGQKTTLHILVGAEALFGGGPSTLPRFEPFTLADGDHDGVIAFEELWSVGVEEFATSGLYVPPSTGPVGPAQWPCFDQDGNPIVIATLGDYAYCMLLPNVATFEGSGACTTMVGRGPGND